MRGRRRTPDRQVERDLEVFQDLVAAHRAQTYRVAYRLAGNHHDAQDLIQESLYEAFRHFDRFERGTRFDRWLYRIMTNRHIDHVRRDGRISVVSVDQTETDADGQAASWDLPDDRADPADLAVDDERAEQIQQALSELPKKYREVVVLVDVEDLSYDETARILRCPVGTVRSRLHRGRQMLRHRLASLPGGTAES